MPHKVKDITALVNLTANTSTQDLFRATIQPQMLGTNRRIRLLIEGTVSTPLVSVPTLTLTIQYGSDTLNLGTTALLLANNITNHPFTLEVTLRGKNSGTTQHVKALLIERMTVPPTTKLANTQLDFATFNQNQSTAKDLAVRVTASGISLGTSVQIIVTDLDILD